MLLGVQVKTGDSFFKERTEVDGRADWWFRESSKEHADYWANYHVPHILVLQSGDMSKRIWVELNRTTIRETGEGIKVFVPEEQVLDEKWKPHWIEIVTEARKLLSFEGARWTFSISQVPESEWARYALLVPRMVAPHPNKGYSSSINWAEALAICANGDPNQWGHFAGQHPEVPDEKSALSNSDPGWRFAAAVDKWLRGDPSELEKLDSVDFSESLRTALAICSAVSALDHYDLNRAMAVLKSAIERELSRDQVWLQVHLAHVYKLQGNIDEAKKILEDCLSGSAALTADITVSALRSACILGLFELAPVFSQDVSSVVTAADNTVAWWRTHPVARGLEVDARGRFKRWSGDRSITIGGVTSAHNFLFSAALTGRFAGDFFSWRNYSSLLAQTELISSSNGNPDDIGASLDLLRQIGDTKSLKLAVRKIRADGPLDALISLAAVTAPENATSLSIRADFEILSQIGDHFSRSQAESWVKLLLDGLSVPDDFNERFALGLGAEHEFLSALNGLRQHLTKTAQISIINYVKTLSNDANQLLEKPLVDLLENFCPDVLDQTLAEYDVDTEPDSWVGKVFRDILTPRSTKARNAVRCALLKGDLTALRGVNDVTRIAADEASVLLDQCDAVFQENKRLKGAVTFGGPDCYRLTTVLSLNGPNEVRGRAWKILVEAIADPVEAPERKRRALEILVSHVTEIPDDWRPRLAEAAQRMGTTPPSSYVSEIPGLRPISSLTTGLLWQ